MLAEVRLRRASRPAEAAPDDKRVWYVANLLGLDVFDPVAMQAEGRHGGRAPAWLLDHDRNEMCSHVGQAFSPSTAAWDNLKCSLEGELNDEINDEVWAHPAGTVPLSAAECGQVAVKVIDDRSNDLMVVRRLTNAEPRAKEKLR